MSRGSELSLANEEVVMAIFILFCTCFFIPAYKETTFFISPFCSSFSHSPFASFSKSADCDRGAGADSYFFLFLFKERAFFSAVSRASSLGAIGRGGGCTRPFAAHILRAAQGSAARPVRLAVEGCPLFCHSNFLAFAGWLLLARGCSISAIILISVILYF